MKLKDKVAVIPGGTAGIGKEIALGYIREGATVAVGSSNEKNVNAMAQEFNDMGHNGLCLVADVTNRSDIDRMVGETVKAFGKIDILTYCSGIYPATPLLEIPEEELLKVIDISLVGAIRCTQAVAKEMVKKGSGSIIYIASGQALIGVPLMAHYSAAKGGVVALARAVAAELSPLGITVNAIGCGPTTTETMTRSIPPEFLEVAVQGVALKRFARPDEFVGLATLLASDEGSFITGETIAVDGGISNVTVPPGPGS